MESTRGTVLVVDDNPSILKMVHRHLDRRVRVETAENSANALQIVHSMTPLIAFIDIHLGDGQRSGISLVEDIRRCDKTMPMCMLTGDRSARTLVECLCAGANDFIWKGAANPTAPESMDRAITRLQDPFAPKGNPILDNSILQSRGLQPAHLKLLAEYAACDFPHLPTFAHTVGIALDLLHSRFRQIYTLLELPDHDSLIRLLKVARGYRGRMSCAPPPVC